MDTIKYSLRIDTSAVEARREALLHKVELRKLVAQPLIAVPSRAVARNNRKASKNIDARRQKASMMHMGQPAFHRQPMADERTKLLYGAWRRRLENGKLG